MRTRRDMLALALVGACLAGAATTMPGCRGDRSDKPPRQFFPDMDHQPKVKPQTESSFFEDGRAQRLPVAGTIAFGRAPMVNEVMGVDFADRGEFLREDDAYAEGRVYRVAPNGAVEMNADGQPAFEWVEMMPTPVTRELIDLGQKQYNIYCLPCHGGTGIGDGIVGTKWSYALPNFHADIYQPGADKGQDGYIFHVIRNGVANVGGPYPLKMPGYARKLTLEETWAVVAYFRVLQARNQGTLDDLPESQRINLERTRTGAATPTPASSSADQEATP
ncbi:MAG: cytochrome c [Planctomycetota bacterium]